MTNPTLGGQVVGRTSSSVGVVRSAGCAIDITNFAYFAPVALLPLDVATTVDLLLGQLDYTVWLNVSSVARVLQGHGLLARPFGPPESADWFMVAGRRDRTNLATIHVAPHVREIMALELVTPPYMAKLADTLLRALSEDPRLVDEKTIVVPGDETRLVAAALIAIVGPNTDLSRLE